MDCLDGGEELKVLRFGPRCGRKVAGVAVCVVQAEVVIVLFFLLRCVQSDRGSVSCSQRVMIL